MNASFIIVIFREIFEFLNLKTKDGVLIVKLREMFNEINFYKNKLKSMMIH